MGDESFSVEVVNANGRAIVSLRGEIDMSCGPALRAALSAARQGSPDVIVDLSGVTFMDSTGLHALIGAYHHAPEGGSLGVVGPTSAVRRVFDITGLSELLLLEPRRPTWQQVTYNHSGWRQWITVETTDGGGPVAEIIEVGSPGDWGGRRVHYALESGGERRCTARSMKPCEPRNCPPPSPLTRRGYNQQCFRLFDGRKRRIITFELPPRCHDRLHQTRSIEVIRPANPAFDSPRSGRYLVASNNVPGSGPVEAPNWQQPQPAGDKIPVAGTGPSPKLAHQLQEASDDPGDPTDPCPSSPNSGTGAKIVSPASVRQGQKRHRPAVRRLIRCRPMKCRCAPQLQASGPRTTRYQHGRPEALD